MNTRNFNHGIIICAILLVGLPTSYATFVRSRNTSLSHSKDSSNSTSSTLPTNRRLVTRDFVPLACNSNVNKVPCTSWLSKFGDNSVHFKRIVIECGECITMDYKEANMNSSKLTLLDGLDIQGKLVFSTEYIPSHSLIVRSTLIVVQGQLDMYATSKAVGGNPQFTLIMISDNKDKYFSPIEENVNACDSTDPQCLAGIKGIIVAGGKLNVHGVPKDCPTWVKLYDVFASSGNTSSIDTIVIQDAIRNKWSVGAEILITSHTSVWNEHQVRTIVKITTHDDKLVKIQLNQTINRPSTIKDSFELAVEVALLSRNIVFESEFDPSNEKIGGHLMVMNTPGIVQTLEGVDVKNFGQQGSLGRYPIHFHFCGNSTGSVVSKNTIRYSNQRCIVVHGTDNMNIEENVAYDTKGHCFLLEDGIETGNHFIRNLGAQIGIPDIIIPNKGTNGKETDDDPSVFWITNPSNSFLGNVAAGSEGSGFWFELLVRGTRASLYPDLNPKSNDLTQFEQNTAHSCSGRAVRTYPSGYVPDNQAKFLGLKVYRNADTGLFLHITHNIDIVDSFFFNNQIGIDIDRANNIRISSSRISAIDEYLNISMTEDEILKKKQRACKNQVVGIELHSWKDDTNNVGVTVENVAFSGFDHNCGNSVPISIDETIKTGMFDLYTTFRNITFNGNHSSTPVNFCRAEIQVIDDVYLNDLDGTLRPSIISNNSTTAKDAGVLISRTAKMLSFIDAKKCTANQEMCFTYCIDTCIRSIRYEIDPAGTEDYRLKVCATSDSNSSLISSNCIEVPGYLRNEWDGWSVKLRLFTIHLPVGNYQAVFVNAEGYETWPNFVDQIVEDNQCSAMRKTNEALTVNLMKPKTHAILCMDLIENGDIENSDSNATHWLFRFGELQLAKGAGIEKSNALSSGNSNSRNTFIQYLDDRCFDLMIGRTYNVSAAIKIVKRSDNTASKCLPGKPEECPSIGLKSDDGLFIPIASLTAETFEDDQLKLDDGYYLLEGAFTVDEIMAQSDQLYLYVESDSPSNRMYVDKVSVKLVLNSTEFEDLNPKSGDGNSVDSNDAKTDDEFESGKTNVSNVNRTSPPEDEGQTPAKDNRNSTTSSACSLYYRFVDLAQKLMLLSTFCLLPFLINQL